MSEPNVSLLKRTLSYIRRYPHKHDQRTWCGTAQCFAGVACHLEGWRPYDPKGPKFGQTFTENFWSSSTAELVELVDPQTGSGMVEHVRVVAVSLLGIDQQDALGLFCGDNELSDIERIVSQIIEDAGF